MPLFLGWEVDHVHLPGVQPAALLVGDVPGNHHGHQQLLRVCLMLQGDDEIPAFGDWGAGAGCRGGRGPFPWGMLLLREGENRKFSGSELLTAD